MLHGAILYAFNDIEFSKLGYIWAFLHVVSMSDYACLVKFTNSGHDMNLTAQNMSLYNNLLSIPFFLFKCYIIMTDGSIIRAYVLTLLKKIFIYVLFKL